MNRISLSLNFMHCMERFARQIYLTQMDSFRNDQPTANDLKSASDNEAEHVELLRNNIVRLGSRVCPLGFLFQFAGVVLGLKTRLLGKRNIFRADTMVETRAVKDYNAFLGSISYDADTARMIMRIIADEERHIANWKAVADSLGGKASASQ